MIKRISPFFNQYVGKHDYCLGNVVLILLVFLTYYHSLFHVARADHLIYLYRTAFPSHDNFWELTIGSYAFNRSDSIGDHVLFRPVLYFLLGWERWAWGHNFFLWQMTSLLLHLGVVLSLFSYLRSINRDQGLLSFSFSLFFGVLLTGTEMVVWQHLAGYLLFCLLAVQALIRFKRLTEKYSVRDSIHLYFFTAVACFTYELGNIFALLISAALISISVGPFRSDSSRNWNRIFRSEDPRLKLSFALAVLPLIYVVVSVGDYFFRFGSNLSMSGEITQSVYPILTGMIVTPLQWFATAFFPSLLNFFIGNRLEIVSLKFSGADAVVTVALGLAVILSIFNLIKGRPGRKFDRNYKILLVTVVGILISYVLLIVIGRELEKGILVALRRNSYYAYIFIMFLMMAIFHSIVPPKNKPAGTGRTRPYADLAILLLLLSAVNAIQVWKIQYHMRYDYSAARIELINRIIAIHKEHSGEHDFSFSMSPNCAVNDRLPWFKAHGLGEREMYSFVDAFFPLSSRQSGGKYLISCS